MGARKSGVLPPLMCPVHRAGSAAAVDMTIYVRTAGHAERGAEANTREARLSRLGPPAEAAELATLE